MIRRLASVALVSLAAACATPSKVTSGASRGAPTARQITFGEQLGQIRGHHLVAVKLYSAGDAKGTAVHTGHPVAELLASVQAEVRGADERLGDAIGPALEAPSEVIARHKPIPDFVATIEKAAAIVDDAETAVLGKQAATTRYKASVVAALTATAGREYAESMKNGKIDLLPEYQDAHGFSLVAKSLYSEIERDVRRAGAEQADEIDGDFATLAKALPNVTRPTKPAAVEDVQRAGSHIGTELEETVRAVLLASVDLDETFAKIDELLTEIVETYRAGDHAAAAELAAEAYLENYEHLEGDVKQLAPKVNAELEPLLGAEMRSKIREGVSTSEIRAMVARARVLLEIARTAITTKDEQH